MAADPDRDDASRDRAALLAAAVVLGLVGVLAALDIAGDLHEGTTLGHLALELAVVAVGLAGASWLALRVRAVTRTSRALALHAGDLERRLDDTRREAERWRTDARDLIAGLSGAIDAQLERWGLSPAEKEIALLLLKGLSHKEIAELREVSEATARQQARAVYKKSGLAGRAELAAFFLEDLLGPREARPGAS